MKVLEFLHMNITKEKLWLFHKQPSDVFFVLDCIGVQPCEILETSIRWIGISTSQSISRLVGWVLKMNLSFIYPQQQSVFRHHTDLGVC